MPQDRAIEIFERLKVEQQRVKAGLFSSVHHLQRIDPVATSQSTPHSPTELSAGQKNR